MITWDDTFSTGIPKIDAQHQKLIEKYNELYQAILNEDSRETAGDTLDFLQFYAAWHFEKGEACMAEYQCPAAAANKKAHAEFLARFGQFYEEWQAGGMDSDLILETYRELGTWIETHIRRIDTRLRACMHEG